jgi:GNAT superfamily N-acetyltransferase
MQIVKRTLKKEEIESIYWEMKKSPNFVGYKRKQLEKFKEVYIATEGNTFCGFSKIGVIDENWVEIDILLILEPCRGKGLGKELFNFSLNKAEDYYRNILIISRNPIVIRWASQAGFKKERFLGLPCPIQLMLFTWAINLYRLKEIVRKSLKFRTRGKWVYLLRINQK